MLGSRRGNRIMNKRGGNENVKIVELFIFIENINKVRLIPIVEKNEKIIN